MKPVSKEDYDKALIEISDTSMKVANLTKEIIEMQADLRRKISERSQVLAEGENLLVEFKNLTIYHQEVINEYFRFRQKPRYCSTICM